MSVHNADNWFEFEKQLAILFSGVQTPGSGSAKKEEDVVCADAIVQAKYTDNINTTIKEADVARLIDACNLVSKLPIFATKTKTRTIISIPTEQLDESVHNVYVSMLNVVAALHTYMENCDANNTVKIERLSHRVQQTIDDAVSYIRKINGVKS